MVQPPSVTHESPAHAARTGLGAEDGDDSEFGVDVWSRGSRMPSLIPESDNERLSDETELPPSESVEYHPSINGMLKYCAYLVDDFNNLVRQTLRRGWCYFTQ